MLKIDKVAEPEFFKEYKKKEKQKLKRWSDYDHEIKKRLREYMIDNEQKGICPYCELKITSERSQIEHIKPKDKFPKLISEYSNYLTGCLNNQTCGQYKENKWSKKFIDPTVENPTDYLTYDIMTGEIIPKEKIGENYEKAKETISFLNLNKKSLCERRKVFIIQNKENEYKYIDEYEEFLTLIEYIKKELM